MCDSSNTVDRSKESAEKALESIESNNSKKSCKLEQKVKERAAYVKLFLNVETLGESIKYFIATPTETHESEPPLEPCLCTKCYKVIYANEQAMGQHCVECQAAEDPELVYVCKKCCFQADTQFETCAHYLEEGSCDGDIEVVRKSEGQKLVYGKFIKKFCQNCAAQKITKTRTNDSEKCQSCDTQLLYVCVKCNQYFTKYLKAKYHLNTQCLTVTHTCAVPKCSFETNLYSTLKRHAKSCHTEKKSYLCKLCPFKSNENKWMSKHLQETHEPNDYYKCDACPWATQEKSSLQRHIRTYHLLKSKIKQT